MHNEKNIKILCRYNGGSHLYRLNNAQSDIDERGVFMTTDYSYILGLKRHDEERKLDETQDMVMRELNHFMRLLFRANTEALECLNADISSFTELDKSFKFIRIYKDDLIDSARLFNSLRGYAQGEYRLALGQRVGVIGSKRREALNQFGFSPKNCTNLLRLLYTGICFFKDDVYIVDCRDFGDEIYGKLHTIKNNPGTYSATQMERDYKDLDKQLEDAYNNRKSTHQFNEVIANWLLLELYFPYLKDAYSNKI